MSESGIVRLLSTFAVSLYALTSAYAVNADPAELRLAIQPVLSESRTRAAFAPLAEYLQKATGRKVVIKTMPNFLAYWDLVRKADEYDLSLDAAHFTSYRADKGEFEVLAKIPDFVSYSIVVRQENLVFEPSELTGKSVATLGAPSIGAARLNAMFPNPMRQPTMIEVSSAETGMQKLLSGEVFAAILPTPIVAQYMGNNEPVSVVSTTEPIPHIALCASIRLDAATRENIRSALTGAAETTEGQKMLREIGFAKFDPATSRIYEGQAGILKQYWGY
jgi:ABC-type phosphate/phosphonate transport system substrate-binding protein